MAAVSSSSYYSSTTYYLSHYIGGKEMLTYMLCAYENAAPPLILCPKGVHILYNYNWQRRQQDGKNFFPVLHIAQMTRFGWMRKSQ